MSHLPIDARAILEYLNELGYRNISAEQLKEFLKDLRKLIKYDERLSINSIKEDYFRSLCRRTTASYRGKAGKENGKNGLNATATAKKQDDLVAHHYISPSKEKYSSPTQRQKSLEQSQPKYTTAKCSSTEKMISSTEVTQVNGSRTPLLTLNENRAIIDNLRKQFSNDLNVAERSSSGISGMQATISRTPPDNAKTSKSAVNPRERPAIALRSVLSSRNVTHPGRRERPPTATSSSAMIVRPQLNKGKSKPRANDPVALYHYYQNEWQHFRQQIPGENSHASLRWQIRYKLLNPE